jgi:peroxiredoxin Q/BCP
VVYFYPRDGTAGCTAQACAFRDAFQDLTDAGAKVIGISSDKESTHSSFAMKYNLPYILLSDTKDKARKLFEVPRSLGLLPGRVTYVLDENGIIRLIFNSQIKVEDHVTKTLEFIRTHQSRI